MTTITPIHVSNNDPDCPCNCFRIPITGSVGYSDTAFSDKPAIVTLFPCPKSRSYSKNDAVTVTTAYSDTLCRYRGRHCNRLSLYCHYKTAAAAAAAAMNSQFPPPPFFFRR